MSNVLDDARHVTFNGYTDTYFDLVLSGNTSLIVPKPKQSSITVPYAHGTVDSSELDGQLYWEDITVEFAFACVIPVLENGYYKSTDQMNSICAEKIRAIEDWLYSGPALLEDTGWSFDLPNSECQNMMVNKVVTTSHWVIEIKATFYCPFSLTMSRPSFVSNERIGRFIIYNGAASYEYGLVMSGSTPLTAENPKFQVMDWPHRNGGLNLSHCRNGLTSGKNSLFFNDRSIAYKFFKRFPKYYNGEPIPTYLMHRMLQDFVIEICYWLYDHSGSSFVTIDGNVTYGGTSIMLADSAWLNAATITPGETVRSKILPSARVSSLSVTKSIYADCWGIVFEVTFATYPVFSEGAIHFPDPQELSPSPSIIFEPWKHYAEFNSFDGEETRILWFQKDHTLQYQAISLNIMDGIYLGCNETIQTYHGTGYREEDGSYYGVGYVKYSSSIAFYNTTIIGPANINISADEYVHPSMENYDTDNYLFPTMIAWVPPVRVIEINGTEYLFIASFSPNGGTYNILMAKFVIRKIVDGETVEMINYGNVGMVYTADYSTNIHLEYVYINENGFYQTIPETEDKFVDLDIDIPIHMQYLQRLSGNDVVDAYGIYAKDNDNAPENFKVLPYEIVFDYTGEELEIYYRNSVTCPLVNTTPERTVHGPEYYRELIANPSSPDSFPGAVAITIPIVNGEANKYILCDGTTPPKGGDIQWLP